MPCDALSIQLAAVADGSNDLAAAEALHVSACLRCQAELVQYRRLLRSLRALRHEPLVPDADLVEELLAALRPPASVTRLHRRNRAAYFGGIAAATAGAAGALVLATRMTRPRLAS